MSDENYSRILESVDFFCVSRNYFKNKMGLVVPFVIEVEGM